ncbi:MAG TPA: 50S ribosomal protein L30 [Candidatus Acidoferrales bacterium]|nr:50S ribosomal protein L30 [Candidatus Acidoferrales bacterium]
MPDKSMSVASTPDRSATDRLRVRLRKSPISYTAKARGTVRALGLHRLHETVDLPDNPATRGMVRSVRFLVEVEQVPAERPAHPGRRRAAPRAVDRASDASAATPDGVATDGPGSKEERA